MATPAFDFDSIYDGVIEALVPRDVPDAEAVCGVHADPKTTGIWLEIFLVDLVGSRRLGAGGWAGRQHDISPL